ncbi:hypothetical protein N9L68_04185 [bacterium]|nr:hypothetical protein [bacterium]
MVMAMMVFASFSTAVPDSTSRIQNSNSERRRRRRRRRMRRRRRRRRDEGGEGAFSQ